MHQFFHLLIPFGHKEQFQRKGILCGILIEFRQKRVVGELLDDQAGIEMFGEHMGKRRFAGPDIAFYGDKVIIHP